MYAAFNALGTINHGQTATINRVGDTNPGPTGATYKTVAGFANAANCGSVELPGGYHAVQTGQTLPPLSVSDVAALTALMPAPDQSTTAPLAPGSPAATGGNTTAALTWTTPNNGGSPILDYTVTPVKDGVNQAPITGIGGPSTQSYTATALVNGHVYSFLIAARNANGTGTAAQTNNVTPQTPVTTPGAPTGLSFTSGEPESADGTWTPPNSDGGATIDSYVITTTPAGPGPQTFSGSPAPTAGTLVGLADGQAYTATGHAHNSQGAGPESAPSASFTPAAPQFVPGTPVAPALSPLAGAVTVVLTPPSAGSSATTAYVIQLYVNGVANGAPTTISGSPPGTSLTITGLTNGSPVTASFHAVNSVGPGPESPQSAPCTPTSPAPAVPIGAMVQLWTGH
jgi:titin